MVKLTEDEQNVLIQYFAGIAIGAILDPLLGYYSLNNPNIPKSPLEPWLETPSIIHLVIDGAVTGIGYATDNQPVFLIGLGMATEKLANKILVWIWNYLRPGYPIWGLPQA